MAPRPSPLSRLGIAELPDNPWSAAKEELGRTLWFDPRLSASWAISCHSCHDVGMGGTTYVPYGVVERPDTSVLRAAARRPGPLQDAVRIMGEPQLGSEPSDEDVRRVTAYLHTLTGDPPVVEHPVLPEIGPDTPLPVPMEVETAH